MKGVPFVEARGDSIPGEFPGLLLAVFKAVSCATSVAEDEAPRPNVNCERNFCKRGWKCVHNRAKKHCFLQLIENHDRKFNEKKFDECQK